MSYARINSFSPSKTTPKSTFSADQRRTALPSLLNSVFHDRGTLSNNEPKKLRQPRSSNNKYYNSVSTTRNLATPKHHGTDLPHSRNNPVIKYSDRGWMTPELVFGSYCSYPWHSAYARKLSESDVLRGNYAIANEKAGTVKPLNIANMASGGVFRSFSLPKHGLIRAYFTDTNL